MTHCDHKLASGKPRRLILIGCDALMPDLVERFTREGHMPVMKALMRRGAFAPLLSSPPVDTPTNWTSLATGAWTGTHGINGFGRHVPGEPFHKVYSNFRNIMPPFADIGKLGPQKHTWLKHLSEVIDVPVNRLCQAEYLWQAAEEAGRQCILVNYPGGWPPNIERGIVVDGAGPYCSKLSRLSPSAVFVSDKGMADDRLQVTLTPAGGEEDAVGSCLPPLKTAIAISGERNLSAGEAKDGDCVGGTPLYQLVVIASDDAEYDQVLVFAAKEAGSPLAVLKRGERSDWLHGVFATEFGEIPAKFKLKLLELSSDGQHMCLQRSPIYNTRGWAYPQHIADELIDFVEGLELEGAAEVSPYVIPLAAVYESIEDQAKSLTLTCCYLNDHYPWDLMFVQIHAPDGIQHRILAELCTEWKFYDPAKAKESWQALREEYQLLDRMIGQIVQDCGDEDTLITVVSDHGALPAMKTVWVGKALADAGLVVYKKDQDTGMLVLDWDHTRAVPLSENPFAKNVWVNLKGRDVQGIVEPGQEYEKVRSEIIAALYNLKDPETGSPVIALALRKEEARFLGQWGDFVGDVVFYLNPGYQVNLRVYSIGPIDPSQIPATGFEATQRAAVQAVHGQYLPTARYGAFSDAAVLLMAGPGIREGYQSGQDQVPVWTVDVAPTLAHLLGIREPAQAEGKILRDFLVED